MLSSNYINEVLDIIMTSVRLLLLFLENNGVVQMAREFGIAHQSPDFTKAQLQLFVSRIAQIVASVPDKARPRAPASLSSQYPVSILCWLLHGLRNSFLRVYLFLNPGKA